MSDLKTHVAWGYAQLLGASQTVFERGGLVVVETTVRDRPEWANWMLPIWFVRIERTVVCSVSPRYARAVRTAFGDEVLGSLLRPELLDIGRTIVDNGEWLQREIFSYGSRQPPGRIAAYPVQRLMPGSEEAHRLLRRFDGGVYAIRDQQGHICAHVGIKDKGLLGEIAVDVEPEFRRRGMGKAVVAHAVAAILDAGKVPVYIPDEMANTASYALARSVGFAKVGEMLAWEYELPGWDGFPLG